MGFECEHSWIDLGTLLAFASQERPILSSIARKAGSGQAQDVKRCKRCGIAIDGRKCDRCPEIHGKISPDGKRCTDCYNQIQQNNRLPLFQNIEGVE
jgi:hypothetical protein